MARGVLGNDPFKRGAALPAAQQPAAPAQPAPPAQPATAAPPKKKTQAGRKAPAPKKKRPAAGKAAAAQTDGRKPAREPRAPPRAPPQLASPVEVAAPEPALPQTVARLNAVDAPDARRNVLAQAAPTSPLAGALGTAAGLWRALRSGLGTAGATELDDYGRDAALARDLHPLGDFVYQRYFRVRVEGAERVPQGAAILVANHSGALPLDGPVLHAALARERADLRAAHWLVEDQIFLAPFVGTLLNRLGAVRACPENALRLLDEGRPVIVFPEGIQGLGKPFRERYRLMRFGRGGFVKIALRTRAPIVPVAILGAEESMPLFGRLPGRSLGLPYLPLTPPPLPVRWTIRFGEPLRVDAFGADAQEDVALIHRLNERTRESVQGMLDAMLQARRGLFA